ncbi:N-acetyltransferase [Photobacterium sanctipauli]|uniref:N-acetyltransferase n=1 Tax=Photobacterium sanctipauli TaxID=1342794 RepID=A0A2T3NVC1_9GAMM|nr:GNAT family N-acetyltransferase [Photobacterium sanctipauli]PSW20224.1 N-acetyltransferase [Photobacterium sanctipauli]
MDSFDSKAFHHSLELNGKLIASIRVTKAKSGLFYEWSNNTLKKTGQDSVVEISRAVVLPQYRGKAIGGLLFYSACLHAKTLGHNTALFGVRVKSPEVRLVKKFGARNKLPKIQFFDTPKQTLGDVFSLDLTSDNDMFERCAFQTLKLVKRSFDVR